MDAGEFRESLRSGKRVYGTSVLAHSPLWPDAVARCGADFVFIDNEHIPGDRVEIAWMSRLYAAKGVTPIVRVPKADPNLVCQVLDSGASGVIAPYVETAEEVRALTGAARWRPLKGKRLEVALDEPENLEPELRRYMERRNAATTLIVNIESVPAIENLDAIVSVPGLDAVLIGPHDLSCSLGVPEQYEHPKFEAAVLDIIRRSRKAGIGAGIHFWKGIEHEMRWAEAGANLILHSNDISLFTDGLNADFTRMRHALGDLDKLSDGEILLV